MSFKGLNVIHYFDTFKDFNDEFKLEGRQSVTTNGMYKPYVEGSRIDMLLSSGKVRTGEPTDEMMDAMKAEMDKYD